MFELSTISWTLVVVGLVTVIYNFLAQRKKSIRYYGKPIPGPIGWPLVGVMAYFTPSNLYPLLEYYTKKYGPIFRVKLGSYEGVVINDYNLIKKALTCQDLTSCFYMLSNTISSVGGHGLLYSNGKIWAEQRIFALRTLNDLGMGKSGLEATVQTEINALLTEWKKSTGKPIDVNVSLNISITNIIWAITAGQRMEYDDPKFVNLVGNVKKIVELGSAGGIMVFLPWMTRVFPKRFLNLVSFTNLLKSFNSYAQDLIDEHKKTIDYDDPKDYVDHFLVKQKKEENNQETTFTNTQLLVTIFDLFAAGGETTASTLRWAVLLISHDLVVQKKIQDEIDQVIGYDCLPSMADYDKMPYTVAVIYEVLRFGNLVPVAFHQSYTDTTFEGYHIPKDAVVIAALCGVHRNPKYWARPYEFYPEHFLDEEGKLRQDVEGFIPFSTGKRTCIGERLARMQLFYFTVSFFQRFNMRLADSPIPNLETDPKSGVIRWPNPYKVIMEERCHS